MIKRVILFFIVCREQQLTAQGNVFPKIMCCVNNPNFNGNLRPIPLSQINRIM